MYTTNMKTVKNFTTKSRYLLFFSMFIMDNVRWLVRPPWNAFFDMGASLYLTSSLTHFLPRKLQTRSCMVLHARILSQMLVYNHRYYVSILYQGRKITNPSDGYPLDIRWISGQKSDEIRGSHPVFFRRISTGRIYNFPALITSI